jgi:hypothetical protein
MDQSTAVERFLETADIARAEGVAPATIRQDIRAGHLTPAALTARGTSLFTEEQVRLYREERQRRKERRAARGVAR